MSILFAQNYVHTDFSKSLETSEKRKKNVEYKPYSSPWEWIQKIIRIIIGESPEGEP